MPKKSSRKWLREHFKDTYVKKAHEEGARSRAVYKLEQIQERDKVLKPCMTVVDLGAAPGGWSEYALKIVGKKGRVIALDLLDIEPIPGVEFIQGDFADDKVYEKLLNTLDGTLVDVVISDIAPNLSGIDSVDQPRSMALAELVLDFSLNNLNEKGAMLIKVFQGSGFDEYLKDVRKNFKKVVIRKPKASRDRSREVYILATK